MSTPTHRVHLFVDFENLPNLDFSLLAGQAIDVTLILGEQHSRLGIELVEQLLERRERVRLVRAGQGGRNAVDFVLAFHLGQAAAADPGGSFHILSADRDFDPLVRHLRERGLHVARHASLEAVPGIGTAPPPASSPKARAAARPAPAADAASRATVIAEHYRRHERDRPRRRTTLLRHINARFNNELPEAEVQAIVDELVASGAIAIGPTGRVTYGS